MATLTVSGSLESRVESVRQEIDAILLEASAMPERMAKELLSPVESCLPALLVLLAGEVTEAAYEEARQAAVAMELLHVWNRMHDWQVPRGGPQIGECEFDPVLLGDFLYVRGLARVARLPFRVMQGFADLSEQLVEEKMRVRSRLYEAEATERAYLERVYAKSAVILATSCKVGAMLGGCASEVKEALTSYGYALGMALQIQEDLRELTEVVSAKRLVFSDELHPARLPLAVIHSLQASQRTRVLLSSRLTALRPVTRVALLRYLQDSGSIAYTLSVAESYLNKAKASLSVLPASLAKCLLLDLANTLLAELEGK